MFTFTVFGSAEFLDKLEPKLNVRHVSYSRGSLLLPDKVYIPEDLAVNAYLIVSFDFLPVVVELLVGSLLTCFLCLNAD